ncbi:MAG: translocation/assembly module TamB domain-containing protein [Xanthomonadales bacterium]|nr:translocation/assembly module TamB domain-containing protein [Xanthomonadales bacterium]
MSRLKSLSIRKIILVGLPVVLMLLFSGSVYWLLNTASGAAWMWKKLEGLAAVDVRTSQLSGDLASGFVIRDMEYRSANLDVVVQHTEIRAGIGWWPLSIRVGRLALQDMEIFVRSFEVPGESSEEGQDIQTTLEGLSLPVPLKVDEVVLTNISLQQDDKSPVKLSESVRFQAALDERLVVDYLDIRSTGLETRLQGYLNLKPPFELAAVAEGRFKIIGEVDQSTLEVPFKLESSGNLEQLHLSLTSDKFGLQLDGEILEPVSGLSWNIEAALDQLSWPETNSEQNLILSDLNLTSQGNINDWSFALDSGLKAGQLNGARFAISGSGSTTGVEIGDAIVTGPGVDFGFNGRLDWSTETEAGLKAIIRQLDLSPWLSDWPVGEQLAGDLELNWSGNRLEIPASQLTVTGSGLMVNIEADIDIGTNSVNAQLDWSNLSWPLGDTSAGFNSESGRLSITGSADEWLASGQMDVRVGNYPQGRFEIQGGGNRTSTHLLIPSGEILGGTLSGEADADCTSGLDCNAAIQTRGIDPEPLLQGWPGRLDSKIEINAQGQLEKTEIKLVELQGLLRDVRVSARGGLQVTGSSLAFESLQVRTDEAVLELNGATTDPAGATVKFSGYLPSRFLGGASGQLELEGRYSSHASHPVLEVQLQALDIAWNGFSINELAANTVGIEPSGLLPALQLDATGVTLNDFILDELSLAFNPVGDQHELKLSMVSESVVLNGLMNLATKNRDNPFKGSWQGELAELEVAVGPAYSFELSKPASFAWSSGSTLLGPLCLSENVGASLCVDLDYQSNGDWSLIADATAIPLNYLRDILELDLHFEQLLEGRMEWHQSQNRAPTGGADFSITAGQILDLLDDEVLTETKEGRFAFTLKNGDLRSGVLDIEFPGTGFIDVDFDVLDIVAGGSQEIQGRALARLDHFKLIGQLALPGVDAADGQFESSIQLGGSLGEPEFEGAFKLSNGLIHYVPIGLQLEDIEFEGQVTQRDLGSFKGQFRAGEGIASLSGTFHFEDLEKAQLDIAMAGEQLLLVNTDSLKILTETDLKVSLGPQRLDINGRVTIPSASLTPANLLLGEVRDSEDLVIETPGVEEKPAVTQAPAKNRVYGQLEVTLGDDVLVKVPGIETSISGSTLFNWSGDPIPMADGIYTLKGKVDVYGPMLSIDNGSISFPGVPADNPLLNIRAGRDIFGNTQIRRAGVRVIGRLKRPVLEAYTVPATNEDRAWTLLITGTDFDQGQGVSGFDVGTYIAPKLYVSYGVSLFEDENVISARYDIKRGFGIKVTSGQRETGLDVSYTIDR